MRRQINFINNNGYPYYLHNNTEFVNYCKKYFEEYPLKDTDRFEIYIDFPFCRSICKFCVYGSQTIGQYKDQIHKYNEAVLSLISDMKDVFPKRINNVYFGGGTPSLWNRDTLLKIIDNIQGYHNANTRTIEVHPIDLTEDWLQFVINDMNIKTVSIGIQSFDIDSNKDQCRIPANINIIRDAIEILHENGKYVNVDLVAFFSPNIDNGWEVFKNDLELAASLHPDDICSSVNFRVKNFYNETIKYREILKEFLDKHSEYVIEHPESLSTNIHDIIDYGEEPYHLRTHEYHKFFNSCGVAILDTKPNILKENVIIGFGGGIGHSAISLAGNKKEKIHSYFSFDKNSITHQVKNINVNNGYKAGDEIPTVHVGNCVIDNNVILM